MISKDRIALYFKSVAVGIADLIPGVSGGTIALMTKIYDRLLAALISLNIDNLKLILRGRFKEAFEKIAWKDLLNIGLGILTALLLFSRLMHFLLYGYPIELFSFMFGLILASSGFLYIQLQDKTKLSYLFFLLGLISGFLVVNIVPVSTPESFTFIFFCGFISICAMLLPGISGSFILLILGKYLFILAALKNILLFKNFQIVLIFALGAGCGLLVFSRILHLLLSRFKTNTIIFLVGVMLSSLWKIWPWKQVIQQITNRGKVYVIEDQNILPNLDLTLIVPMILFLFGIFIIFKLEKNTSYQ